jgi:pimeloyl-ACP methyl ester carboxylesterase
MHWIVSDNGVRLSYEREGTGPPLVLVHGAFSDHQSNWELVRPAWSRLFTVYAIARRGRGATDATRGHTIEDEARDAAALIRVIGQPVFLLGHSYGAHVALAAAALIPDAVKALVLYEPPLPELMGNGMLDSLVEIARRGDWDAFSLRFFHRALLVPIQDLAALRGTPAWRSILVDAEATLGDLNALSRYHFEPRRFSRLSMPVLLQTGSESPAHLYVTAGLAEAVPAARMGSLEGQAHEAMTTAPELYARAVTRFLTGTDWTD